MYAFWALQLQKPDCPARAYLRHIYAIARNKGLDALRRLGYRAKTNVHDLLTCIEDDVSSRPVGSAWKQDLGESERAELRQTLLNIVEELPKRQRVVARVVLDQVEQERENYEQLARRVSAITGQVENPDTVKHHWLAARKSLAQKLAERGYFIERQAP